MYRFVLQALNKQRSRSEVPSVSIRISNTQGTTSLKISAWLLTIIYSVVPGLSWHLLQVSCNFVWKTSSHTKFSSVCSIVCVYSLWTACSLWSFIIWFCFVINSVISLHLSQNLMFILSTCGIPHLFSIGSVLQYYFVCICLITTLSSYNYPLYVLVACLSWFNFMFY